MGEGIEREFTTIWGTNKNHLWLLLFISRMNWCIEVYALHIYRLGAWFYNFKFRL